MIGSPGRAQSRTQRRSAAAVALLTAATVGLQTSNAKATIVWQGREVPAWPDLPAPPTSGTASVEFAKIGINQFPHPAGVVRGLTILIDFSDQAPAYTKAQVDAWLNAPGYKEFKLTGSVRDYFLAQSNGKVDYQNTVYGFYRAKKAKSYYQGGTSYERADELWAEVVAALDPEIDFSTFDNDKDGKTDAISILYAGDEGTFGKGLWPHAGGSNESRDGVRLARYMMTAMNNQPTNYVFSHESGHMLFGWPDLYGVGDYCLMANRGSDTNPVGINDMFRADQGWIEITDIDATTNARLTTVPDGVAYRFLNPADSTEYYLWSNVQNSNEWVSLKGGGLLVWHFDKAIRGNNPPDPLQLAVVQGGGTRVLGATTWPSPGSAATDFFASSGNSELAANTQPASKWNDGSASGLRIYDISASGPSMQFSVGTGPIPPTGGAAGANGGGGNTSGGQNSGGAAVAGAPSMGLGGSSGSGGSATGSGGVSLGSGGTSTSSGGATQGGASVGAGGSPLTTGGTVAGGNSAAGVAGALPTAGASTSATPDASAEASCSCRVGATQSAGMPWLLAACLVTGISIARRRKR